MANRFHGVYYSTSRAAPHGYNGLVSVWRGGQWVETLVSATPLPSRGAAWGEASAVAKRKGMSEGLRIKCVDGGPMHRIHVAVPVAIAA